MICYAKSLQSCPTLCDPIDASPPGSPSLGFSRQGHWCGLPFQPLLQKLPGSSVHEIFQARVLEWGATAFSITRLAYLISPKPVALFLFSGVVCVGEGTAAAATAKSLQSCPTLCDPIDSSSPGSPVPGILQARTLEWVAISFSSA